MKHIIAIQILIAIFLLFLIMKPLVSQDLPLQNGEGPNEPVRTEEPARILSSRQLVFELEYEKYLIPYPYVYNYQGEERVFRFQDMIEKASTAAAESEKGILTYVSNYKDENGRAPLYKGKTVDADGTLRGAAAPAYPTLTDQEEFDYLPDGTLVRILERHLKEDPEFSKIYSILDQKEYYMPNKYLQLDRQLEEIKKVIVVDLTNQTIAALEKEIRQQYFKEANAYLRTDWKIISYSKATTGKLGYYHQPTPVGYFYAMEKKPFFYYLVDGTNVIGGQEPWAIRFTAGAYVHGMSLGEYSPAIGTVPLSHKCVRNYTSHARFLYDWYEEDRTIVIVIE